MSYKAITIQSPDGVFADIITDAGISLPIGDIYHPPSGLRTYRTSCLWGTGSTLYSMTTRPTWTCRPAMYRKT